MDLTVTRFYSSQIFPDYESGGSTSLEEDNWAGLGWRLHWGRILRRETITACNTADPVPSAVVELPGGFGGTLHKRQGHLSPSFTDGCITDGLARFEPGTNTLKLPNGRIYTFGHQVASAQHGTVRYVTKIEDPFGNKLEFDYFSSPGPTDGVQEIRQYVGETSPRVVTFTYDATLKSLATMTYAGRTWTYSQSSIDGSRSRLNSVTAPTTAVTSYSYGTNPWRELTQITTPAGGTVTYTYQSITRAINSATKQARVVATRVVAGWNVPSGTWTFSYSQGTNNDWSYVISPCGRTEYRYLAIGSSGPFKPWKSGLMAERVTKSTSGTVLEREELEWDDDPSVMISEDDVPAAGGLNSDDDVRKPLLLARTLTRGSGSWTTTYAYHTTDQNDYLQPYQITETGEGRTRVTTRLFSHSTTPYFGGRVQSETVTENGQSATSSRAFDATTGFITSATARGITTTFAPNSRGQVASITDAAGKQTTFTYQWGVAKNVTTPLVSTVRTINPDGTVASEAVGSSPNDLLTSYAYDTAGRLTRINPPGVSGSGTPPGAITYAYDANHRWVRVTQSEADGTKYNQTTTDIDGLGRLRQTTDSFGVKVKANYNGCGQATYTSYPFTSASEIGTTTAYDALGRPTSVTAPGSAVTSYSYTANDVTVTDAEGHATTFTYRAAGTPDSGYLSSVTDARGNTTGYTYDLFGNLKTVAVPGVPTRQWNYHTMTGRLTSETHPENGTTSYTYTTVGNVQTVTTADSQVTTFTYDDNHRLKTRTRTGDTTSNLELFYNSNGSVWKQTVPGVTTEYTFVTGSGQVATRKDTVGSTNWTSAYAYDKRGNLTSLTYPSSRVVTYTYARENRLTNVAHGGGTLADTFDYHDNGQLKWFKTGTVTQQVTLDAQQRVQSIGIGSLLNLTYSYDDVGNITAIADTRPGHSATFDYDELDRLTRATRGSIIQGWTFDAAGNRLAETGTTPSTFTYNSATERLSSVSGALNDTFTYTPLGQLWTDSQRTYTYTPTGRLKAVSGAVTASYGYDPHDLRLSRTVNGHTIYTVRGAGQQVLSEYQTACTGLVWSRDLLYAGGKLIGAARSTGAQPGVEVTATSASLAETATSASVGVRITTGGGPLGCAVTVAWETRPATATPGADYTHASGTLTFAAGTASGATQQIPLALLPDALDEDDETIVLALTSAVGGQVGAASAQTLTITDDDPTPALSLGNISVLEPTSGASTASLTVTLSAASGRTVTATYATANGTAAAGSDYTAVTGTLTFAPGEVTKQIHVPVLSDATPEPAETFTVALSGVVNATPPAGPATVTITAYGTLTMTLTANQAFPSPAGTAITFTGGASGGTAPYEYLFRLTQHATGSTRMVQSYFPFTTWTWTPAAPGTYTVEVWGRTQGSTDALQGIATLGPFTIGAAPAVAATSLSANTTFPMASGTTVTWTAGASGGVGPLQYEFWVNDVGAGTWEVFRPYDDAATAPWVARQQGTYNFAVRVRSAGSAAAWDAATSVFGGTVNLAWPSVQLFTPDRSLPVAVNTPVTWTTTASGTAPLEYKYWAYRPSTSWVLLQDWTLSPNFLWTPTVADTYSLAVHVRVVGSPLYYDVAAEVPNQTVVSGAISATGVSANEPLPLTAGTPITWTATATGGTGPLQYEFWLYDGTTGTWTTPRAYSSDPTWTWTPGATSFGQHAVVVRIRVVGSPNAWDAVANSGHFTVTP